MALPGNNLLIRLLLDINLWLLNCVPNCNLPSTAGNLQSSPWAPWAVISPVPVQLASIPSTIKSRNPLLGTNLTSPRLVLLDSSTPGPRILSLASAN